MSLCIDARAPPRRRGRSQSFRAPDQKRTRQTSVVSERRTRNLEEAAGPLATRCSASCRTGCVPYDSECGTVPWHSSIQTQAPLDDHSLPLAHTACKEDCPPPRRVVLLHGDSHSAPGKTSKRGGWFSGSLSMRSLPPCPFELRRGWGPTAGSPRAE